VDSVGDQTINLPIGALARPAAPTVVDALVVLGRDGSFGTASREVSLSDGLLRDGVLQPLPPGGRAALDRLPADQREALVLVGASGFSYEETAEICNCAVGTIKSRVNRARRRLGEMLAIETAEDFGPDQPTRAALGAGHT